MTPRLLAGFAATPFVAAGVGFLVAFVQATGDGRLQSNAPVEMGLGLAAYFFAAALVIVFLAAAPLFFWLAKRRSASFLAVSTWAAVLGNIPTLLGMIIVVARRPLEGWRPIAGLFALGTTTGLVCGALFWFIVTKREDSLQTARARNSGD